MRAVPVCGVEIIEVIAMRNSSPMFSPSLVVTDTGTVILPHGDTHVIIVPQRRLWLDGQSAKVHAAVRGLCAAGQLPPLLTLSDVRHRCDAWLIAHGLRSGELPSNATYLRHLPQALARVLRLSELGLSDTG